MSRYSGICYSLTITRNISTILMFVHMYYRRNFNTYSLIQNEDKMLSEYLNGDALFPLETLPHIKGKVTFSSR